MPTPFVMEPASPTSVVPSGVPSAAPGPASEHVLADMALVVAHRLRGLVTGIEGYTSLLTETLPSRDQRDLALRILEGAASIERVLSDLQAYSAPLHPVLAPAPLDALIDAVVAAIEDAEQARIEVAFGGGLATPVQADSHLLHQALLVLIQNALDASPDGPVRLEAEVDEAGFVALHVWSPEPLPVPDAGEVVFRPFFTTKPKNLGLGLPLARRIAEAHGGSLLLSANAPEGGACFTLRLPQAEG